MSLRELSLTSRDHANMDQFLAHVLDDYKSGALTKEDAVGGLAHVMAALEIGNTSEAVNWFEQGRKLLREGR